MIEIKNVTKMFGELKALDSLNFNVSDGSVFGLVGSNGAGKSTLLRVINGVFEPDAGEVLIEGENSFENPSAKEKCYFIPDFPYFYNSSTIQNTAYLYRKLYPDWDEEYFNKLCATFPINTKSNIINMSKGMQRQAALILALSTRPKYLFLDEITSESLRTSAITSDCCTRAALLRRKSSISSSSVSTGSRSRSTDLLTRACLKASM